MSIEIREIQIYHIDKKQDKVQLLYEFAGELDLKLSVLSFRKSLNEYCIPVIEKQII